MHFSPVNYCLRLLFLTRYLGVLHSSTQTPSVLHKDHSFSAPEIPQLTEKTLSSTPLSVQHTPSLTHPFWVELMCWTEWSVELRGTSYLVGWNLHLLEMFQIQTIDRCLACMPKMWYMNMGVVFSYQIQSVLRKIIRMRLASKFQPAYSIKLHLFRENRQKFYLGCLLVEYQRLFLVKYNLVFLVYWTKHRKLVQG